MALPPICVLNIIEQEDMMKNQKYVLVLIHFIFTLINHICSLYFDLKLSKIVVIIIIIIITYAAIINVVITTIMISLIIVMINII